MDEPRDHSGQSPPDTARDETVTRILDELAEGERSAVRDLLPVVYDELRRMAAAAFRDQAAGHTLQPTVLVHEVFLRMDEAAGIRAGSRAQFFALASKVMRHVLVDHARSRRAAKRGGGWQRVTLSGVDAPAGDEQALDVIAIEEALERLASMNADDARLAELRYFGGMTAEDAAAVIGISRTEAARRWRTVRAWLAAELGETGRN